MIAVAGMSVWSNPFRASNPRTSVAQRVCSRCSRTRLYSCHSGPCSHSRRPSLGLPLHCQVGERQKFSSTCLACCGAFGHSRSHRSTRSFHLPQFEKLQELIAASSHPPSICITVNAAHSYSAPSSNKPCTRHTHFWLAGARDNCSCPLVPPAQHRNTLLRSAISSDTNITK